MNILTQNIRDKMKALKLTQKELAERVSISQVMVHKLTSGKVTTTTKIVKLAEVLECSPEWLLNGVTKQSNSNIEAGPDIKDFFPLISWVQAGAWEAIEEVQAVDAERFPCPVNCSSNTFVLKVQGVSMQPIFRDGDLIFVDPDTQWRHGAYVVARLDDQNEATFKQLIIESGQKFLKPANPNWPEQIIPINGNCTIVGVVVFSGRAF